MQCRTLVWSLGSTPSRISEPSQLATPPQVPNPFQLPTLSIKKTQRVANSGIAVARIVDGRKLAVLLSFWPPGRVCASGSFA